MDWRVRSAAPGPVAVFFFFQLLGYLKFWEGGGNEELMERGISYRCDRRRRRGRLFRGGLGQ